MTNQEAIEILKDLWTYLQTDIREALEMAIKALEQEPEILDTLDLAINISNGDTNYLVGFRNGLRYSKSLIDGEEPQFESCTEQNPCSDAISRQAVLDIVNNPLNIRLDEIIKKLPPVTSRPKIGHWIGIDEEPHEDYECDNCGFIHTFIDGHTAQYNYCPNCGAKMVEPQESEDKE